MRLRSYTTGALTIIVLLVGVTGLARADDKQTIPFDVYGRDDCVTVWMDMSGLISSHTVEQLKDGVGVIIEYEADLSIPRRFLGNRRVARETAINQLSYLPVTEEYRLSFPVDSTEPRRQFVSLASTFQYLRDSIELCLLPMDSLESEEHYKLTLKVTTISLTDFNIGAGGGTDNRGSSVEFLFRQFLQLTGYGRTEFQAESRPISPAEILPVP